MRLARSLILLLAVFASSLASAYTVVSSQILDANQRSVQLRGINWFGLETDIMIPHGLWARNWKELIDQVQAAGFNAVRLPLCPATIRGGTVGGLNAELNPDLVGLNSQKILDALVDELDRRGIYILLDHHRPDCQKQSELWYTEAYAEREWIADLVTLAERYKNLRYLLGVDLKNEPHGAASWGTGDKTTDWNLAAERASAAVLKVAPNWLIFVEGIGHGSQCNSKGPHFWGENLEPIDCAPLKIPRNKLVLSPHSYGPDVATMPYFNAVDFPKNMPAIWDQHFGRLALHGYAVVPGEFGGGYGRCANPADRAWQNQFVRYLIDRGIDSGFFWSLNPNSDQTGGLLQDDWKTFWPDKLALLKHYHSKGKQPLPGPLTGLVASTRCSSATAASIDVTPTKPPPSGSSMAARGSLLLKELPAGNAEICREGTVVNTSGSPIAWQQQLPLTGKLLRAENLRFDAAINGRAWAKGSGPMATLAPGEQASFRYCSALPDSASPVTPEPAISPPTVSPTPRVGLVPTANSFRVSTEIESQWKEGYCTRVTVTNLSQRAQPWRVKLPLRGKIRELWKARFTATKTELSVEGEDYNRVLKPHESTDFGFCALIAAS